MTKIADVVVKNEVAERIAQSARASGTISGRFSSKNPNMESIPKTVDGEIDSLIERAEALIRDRDKLDSRFRIRVTKLERLKMIQYAESQGRSLSEWCRHVLVGELRRRGIK